MRLSAFINANLDLIIADWVAFARQQLPAASSMDQRALVNHCRLLLQEIAADMHRSQDDAERQAKSEGQSEDADPSRNVPSRAHARERERQGFLIEQMVAEYRALRATVVRLWSASTAVFEAADLEDMIRFNEAVDQAVAESLAVFLVEVERSRDLFLGVLGHDLRGPLNTITICATIDRKSRPEDTSTASIVLRSAAQMKALLDDLVAYTGNRLGNGLSLEPAPLHLEAFARDTLHEIAPLSRGRALALDAQGDTAGEWDAKRLHQALSNLVFNALKYGYPGSPVRVSVDGRDADEVVLAVSNAGRPVPPALLARIFDPLVRAETGDADTDPQLAGANMGLGLYVVREIATAHGGTIEATSDDSVTRFALRLPRKCVRHTGSMP